MAKLILKKSSVVTDGLPKAPTVQDLEYGELAINYAVGRLYYKKSDNTISEIGITSLNYNNLTNVPAIWAKSFMMMGA